MLINILIAECLPQSSWTSGGSTIDNSVSNSLIPTPVSFTNTISQTQPTVPNFSNAELTVPTATPLQSFASLSVQTFPQEVVAAPTYAPAQSVSSAFDSAPSPTIQLPVSQSFPQSDEFEQPNDSGVFSNTNSENVVSDNNGSDQIPIHRSSHHKTSRATIQAAQTEDNSRPSSTPSIHTPLQSPTHIPTGKTITAAKLVQNYQDTSPNVEIKEGSPKENNSMPPVSSTSSTNAAIIGTLCGGLGALLLGLLVRLKYFGFKKAVSISSEFDSPEFHENSYFDSPDPEHFSYKYNTDFSSDFSTNAFASREISYNIDTDTVYADTEKFSITSLSECYYRNY